MKHQELNMNSQRPAINPFQCALLLDDQGHEIAITEEMIQQACADLAKRCQFPEKKAA